MTQLMQRPEHSAQSTAHFFKWPLILAGLTLLSFVGMAIGGIGPCGGGGIFFIPPFLLCGAAAIVMFFTGCCRAFSQPRNEQNA